MTRLLALLLLPLALAGLLARAEAGEPPAAREPSAPGWSKDELRGLLTRAQGAGAAASVEAQDQALAEVAGLAYRVGPEPSETVEAFARRALKRRRPDHPTVQKGQWLAALLRQLYEDIGQRAAVLARFEVDRRDRVYLEDRAREAAGAAAELAKGLQVVVEGLEGFFEPLPVVDGDAPRPIGATATVKGGTITIENLERLRFVDDRPAAEAARTPTGALRELFAAMQQYNQHAQLLGAYDAAARRGHGHLRAVIPARAPALYLNELVRAAKQARMHTLHVMTMSKAGVLAELPVALAKSEARPARKGKAAAPAPVAVSCDDGITLQQCAERLAHPRPAPVLYVVE